MTATDIAKKILAKLEPADQRKVLDWLHEEVYHPVYCPPAPRHAPAATPAKK